MGNDNKRGYIVFFYDLGRRSINREMLLVLFLSVYLWTYTCEMYNVNIYRGEYILDDDPLPVDIDFNLK